VSRVLRILHNGFGKADVESVPREVERASLSNKDAHFAKPRNPPCTGDPKIPQGQKAVRKDRVQLPLQTD
jgi:hypothetical protein